ncbi:MAG TPA: hypothetical protein PKE47_11340 [Verrucomicrobiota bacterium]|nr:hypothetical protein [Verrucomicrobiota bacterium]
MKPYSTTLGLLALFTVCLAAAAAPAGRPFTYQGDLRDTNGVVFNGSVDLRVGLYDSSSGGSLVGSWIELPGVGVTNGRLNVPLDFDAGAFAGGPRWLDFQVRPAGAETFDLLSPRQEISPVPVALYALSAPPAERELQQSGMAAWHLRSDWGILGLDTWTLNQDAGIRLMEGGVLRWHLFNSSAEDKFVIAPNQGRAIFIDQTGAVGINTANPKRLVHVGSPSRDFSNDEVHVEAGISIQDRDKEFVVTPANGERWVLYAQGGSIRWWSGQDVWFLDNGGNLRLTGRINAAGATFDSNVSVRELEIRGGSDLAERFTPTPEATDLKPGMVVSYSSDGSQRILASTVPYDRAVCGIVSGGDGINPGVSLGQAGPPADGSLPVAHAGRVRCLADATYGPIAVGDLLTSSATLGHAMKADLGAESRGTIIGKATSGLESGRGWVWVHVMLQ